MTTRWIVLTAALTVAAPASAAVSGRVRSADGKPLSATVTAYALETFEARAERIVAGREKPALASVKAAADGTFRLEAADAMVGIGARAEGYAPTFATVVQGEPATLTLRPALLRRGRVTSGGAPVVGALLQWTTNLGDPQSAELLVRSRADGSYEIPDPDQWAAAVAIFHPGFAPLSAAPAPKWAPSLRHELLAGIKVEGRVTDQRSGAGLAGAALWLDGWPRARSGPDGSFAIAHASKDWSRVEARGAGLVGIGKRTAGRLAIAARPVRRLTGAVRDSVTRRPLAGAMVTVIDDAGRRTAAAAVTDAAGQYSLAALPPGKYWPSAARPGYEAGTAAEPLEAIDLRLVPVATHDFVLDPMRRVTGRVADEQGRPVDGATVSIGLEALGRFYGEFANLMAGEGQSATTESTAADGTFALLMPKATENVFKNGNFQPAVLAWKAGHAAGLANLPAAAAPVVVTLIRGVAMAGRVVDPDGAPVPDVAITVIEPGILFYAPSFAGRLPVVTRTGADGGFSIQVNPTRLFLSAGKPGYATKTLPSLDARGGRLAIVLDRGAAIRGRVVRSDGRGLGEAGLALQDAATPPVIVASTVAEADGSFAFADLAAGEYQLMVWHQAAGLQARRTVQAPATDLRVELAPTAAVRGRVTDAATRAPVTRFWVSLNPDPSGGPPSGDFPGGRSEEILAEDGAFAVDDVPLGTSRLTVQAEGYRPKSMESVAVSAQADAPALEIALDPGISLQGRVTSDGQPLADASVTATAGGRDEESATTDENGDYALEALPGGEAVVRFGKEGYQSARRTLEARPDGRLDVVLTRGLTLAGMVVANDVGIAHARVSAESGVLDADGQSAVTDAAGRFTLSGLSPARYTLSAAAEQGKAELKDVDVATSGPVRLVIEGASHAVLTGTVTGAGEPGSGPPQVVMVLVKGVDGGQAFAIAEPSGAFRIADAPAGRVSVAATAGSRVGTRTTESVELTLAPGGEATVALAFKDELQVTGTVTRSGAPVPGVMVFFAEGERSSTATTDREGRYRVDVSAGAYVVSVWGDGVSFRTEQVVSQSGAFDIDVTGGTLRGRVVDAAAGSPIAAADVSLWLLSSTPSNPTSTTTSSAEGAVLVSSLREGRYRLVTTKKGYGQDVRELEVTRGGTAEALVEMRPADGVTVTVTDARDGRALEAIVVVRDAARRVVANRHAGADQDGAVIIPLADGAYLLSTSASGYGTATLPIRAPARGVKVALTPGGTLIIESPRPIPGRVKLVQPDGEEYVRCWCNGIAEIKLEGRRTTVENVAPGTYTMELVDAPDMSFSRRVTIQEGQVTTVAVEIP